MMSDQRTGAQRIADERLRQVEKEGYTAAHDADHAEGALALAAACYAAPDTVYVRREYTNGSIAFEEPERPKLLPPAQLERIVGKPWVKSRVQMVSSGLKMVQEFEAGEATSRVAMDFDDDFFKDQ